MTDGLDVGVVEEDGDGDALGEVVGDSLGDKPAGTHAAGISAGISHVSIVASVSFASLGVSSIEDSIGSGTTRSSAQAGDRPVTTTATEATNATPPRTRADARRRNRLDMSGSVVASGQIQEEFSLDPKRMIYPPPHR